MPDTDKPRYPSLDGRTVLVTGGSTGIGAAIVEAFVGQNARVGFLDIDAAGAEALVAKLDGKPVFRACDLTDLDAATSAIQELQEALGAFRVLVNNAGNDERHATADVTPDYWDRVMALNLKHQFFCAQAVQPGMKAAGGGSIINLSSIAWMFGAPRLVAYAAAKAATVGMTHTLAREWGPDRIRVNAIAPGAVITERQRRLWYSDAQVAEIVARQCLPGILEADAIADIALFLASDESRMLTKQCITVDAGLR
jgi:NAD(P)-dependent dehydrogenase (short-subunit alcohol dehydrogenase family)